MSTPAARLKHARKLRGMNQIQLAEKAGVATGTVGNIESGKRGIKSSALALARALSVSPDWLATGDGPMEPSDAIDVQARWLEEEKPNVTELAARAKVPLISWVQAGEFSDVLDVFHPGEAVQWEDAIASKPSRHGYALLVEGDSMTAAGPGISFPAGTVLIVDPDRACNAGDYVIAKDVQTQKATFKQLVTDGARWYLKAINTLYPMIEIDDPKLRIIGRVMEAKPPSIKL